MPTRRVSEGKPGAAPPPAPRIPLTPLRHIAVILDGNRRWARINGLDVQEGYLRGTAKVHEFLEWCHESGIRWATLWVLSLENLRRNPRELSVLLSVLENLIDELAADGRWHIRALGETSILPPSLANSLTLATQLPAKSDSMNVNVAIAYSGRDEIVCAMRALLVEHAMNGTSLEQLAGTLRTEDIAGKLYTTGQPDPDLIIRTSGEHRLSGFMSWQSAYSECYFPAVLWPDFTREDFREALETYRHRQRNFGA